MDDKTIQEAGIEAEQVVGQALIQINQLMDGMLRDKDDMAQRFHILANAGVAMIVNSIGNTADSMKRQGRDDEVIATATADLTAMLVGDVIKHCGLAVTVIAMGEVDKISVSVTDHDYTEALDRLREKAGLEPEVAH
jgi:hypothetical protein